MLDAGDEAMRVVFELNRSYHEPEDIRRLFSQLTGNRWMNLFGYFRHSTPILERILQSVQMYLSTHVAIFRIKGGSYWAMDAKLDIVSYLQP